MIKIDKNGIRNITGKGFRLVHNGKKVIALIEGTDKTITSTIYKVEEFKTEQEAFKRIKELGLEYEPPKEFDIEKRTEFK